ncbi:hypothetical protein B484DRAFT_443932 [Ochromonadaceae sp. CCMP2298]|nr:hypothetical protein B484DRAFT_443932 [Ochromonadaceae sp. CCMP2298]
MTLSMPYLALTSKRQCVRVSVWSLSYLRISLFTPSTLSYFTCVLWRLLFSRPRMV